MLSEIIRTYREINEKVGDIIYRIGEGIYETLVPEVDYGLCCARILPDKREEYNSGAGKQSSSKSKRRGKDKKTLKSDFVKRNRGPKDRNKQSIKSIILNNFLFS